MSPSPFFLDRADAGIQLAQLVQLEMTKNQPLSTLDPIVYALPRGGLPVAAPVAELLRCPLNVILAKKITRPENPELAIGAVTADGYVLWSQQAAGRLNAHRREAALRQAQEKAQAQLAELSPKQPKVSPQGRLVLLVDDGIATGMTMIAAAQALKAKAPASVWICAPVAPPDLIEVLYEWADQVVVVATPEPFLSVSRFYQDFPQVEMSEAMLYLQRHHAWLASR